MSTIINLPIEHRGRFGFIESGNYDTSDMPAHVQRAFEEAPQLFKEVARVGAGEAETAAEPPAHRQPKHNPGRQPRGKETR